MPEYIREPDAIRRASLAAVRAAVDLEAVETQADPNYQAEKPAGDVSDLIARRKLDLTAYQGRRLARRYEKIVTRVRSREREVAPDSEVLADAVARNLFKLMAYKDEYEVGRLYSDGRFKAELESQFEGDYTLTFHLAPPLWSKINPETGLPVKRDFGPWMGRAMTWLARFRFLRGTPLDIFGRTEERRVERRQIEEYKAMIEEILPDLKSSNLSQAIRLAQIPEMITGYGHFKTRHREEAMALRDRLLVEWGAPGSSLPAAAE